MAHPGGRDALDFFTFALAFGLFRLFDIWKPPPIRLIEQVPGGAGIVLDDMMAGAYGALVLFLWDGSIISSAQAAGRCARWNFTAFI